MLPAHRHCVLCWINGRQRQPTDRLCRYTWTDPDGTRLFHGDAYYYCERCKAHCERHGRLTVAPSDMELVAALALASDPTYPLPHEPNGEELTWTANLRDIGNASPDLFDDSDGEEWKRGSK